MKNLLNKVFCGDSKKILKKFPDKFVTLVYLDPPFYSDRNYEIITKNGTSNSFSDKWPNGLDDYLENMSDVLTQCKRILTDNGSLYLHCDWHASHYLKVELDKIFGRHNFRNEIVWRRHNAHNDTKQGSKSFGRVHDVILFYSKTSKYKWNPMFQSYSEEYIKKSYRHEEPDTGRKYAHGDLSGPGGKSKGNPRYRFLGVTRYWRFSKKRMYQLYQEGRIIQTAKGNVPLLKRYLDEMPGIMLQDVWSDIDSVQTVNKKESVDYPTQKPERLLERIIQISSDERDVVLDPFCGSGTTLVASRNLGRHFVGIDSNMHACIIARKRIKMRKTPEPKKLVIQKFCLKN